MRRKTPSPSHSDCPSPSTFASLLRWELFPRHYTKNWALRGVPFNAVYVAFTSDERGTVHTAALYTMDIQRVLDVSRACTLDRLSFLFPHPSIGFFLLFCACFWLLHHHRGWKVCSPSLGFSTGELCTAKVNEPSISVYTHFSRNSIFSMFGP